MLHPQTFQQVQGGNGPVSPEDGNMQLLPTLAVAPKAENQLWIPCITAVDSAALQPRAPGMLNLLCPQVASPMFHC